MSKHRIFYHRKFSLSIIGKITEEQIKKIMEEIKLNHECIESLKITDVDEEENLNHYIIEIILNAATYEYLIDRIMEKLAEKFNIEITYHTSFKSEIEYVDTATKQELNQTASKLIKSYY
ncbi:MAG: hypothetical protein GF317_09825 [Candidatus Lokiarchaeota archaeon]|nr:hypothetical protein [Candidatus Lokiarchaeota archaeon]